MLKDKELSKFRFITKISKMGEGNKIIWIPKEYHKDIAKFEDKQVRVIIDDEI